MVDEILKQEKLATAIDLNTDEQHATKMRKKNRKIAKHLIFKSFYW